MRLGQILGRMALLVSVAMTLSGCVAFKAVGAAGELAATSVIVVGKTATKVVTTTGKVAASAIGAGGTVTSGTIRALAALSQAGMVNFVDVASNAIVRVPWMDGLTLSHGAEIAQIEVARKAVALVRGGRLAYAASKRPRANLRLQAGDVVRLAEGR